MSNMNSFFDELVEAKKAMEALPTVSAERDRAKGELEVTLRRLDEAYNVQLNFESDIDILRRELAAKEAELAQATFREGEVRSQLEMLVGTFKSVVGDASAAIDLVTPKAPEPVAEPTPTPADPVGQEPNGGDNTPYAPFASTTTGTTETDATSVTDIPNWRTPQVEEVTQSNSGPTVSSMADGSAPANWEEEIRTMESGTAANAGVTASQPEPEPYWKKPDGITWRQWQNQGNELPWWSHSADFALDNTH